MGKAKAASGSKAAPKAKTALKAKAAPKAKGPKAASKAKSPPKAKKKKVPAAAESDDDVQVVTPPAEETPMTIFERFSEDGYAMTLTGIADLLGSDFFYF